MDRTKRTTEAEQPKDAREKEKPMILITDYTNLHLPFTTHYIQPITEQTTNNLETTSLFSTLLALRIPVTCIHPLLFPGAKCLACETAWLDSFHTCTAQLLDYFADFLSIDTALMQSLWFRLFDLYQVAAYVSPYFTSSGGNEALLKFLPLFHTTIFGFHDKKRSVVPGGLYDAIFHPPDWEGANELGKWQTGPWISGVKKWGQFLLEGAPGVDCRVRENTPDRQMHVVPMGAIAIVFKHSERMRAVVGELEREKGVDEEGVVRVREEFDAKALAFPALKRRQLNSEAHTYTSMFNQTVTYTLTTGLPNISRAVGQVDPDFDMEFPDFNAMDELVGEARYDRAYVPMSQPWSEGDEDDEAADGIGEGGNDEGGNDVQMGQDGENEDEDGEEQEEREEEEEEEERIFDMWTVKCETNKEGCVPEMLEDMDDLFDYWIEDEDF